MFGAILGALAFVIVPPVVKCAKYPDLCIQQLGEDIRYIKGNYTVVYDRFLADIKETQAKQEDVIDYTGEYISILDYNITTHNNTIKSYNSTVE